MPLGWAPPGPGVDGDGVSHNGQQLGKVKKVNVTADGRVTDVEVSSAGFLGFFLENVRGSGRKAA
jgi:hypothetical protein